MSIIIKLQGLPLDATSIDVRRYFLGLTIPDGGVHIVGGDEGSVFIEFASDEDARQAMSRGDGTIKNSNVKLLLSSRTEMQSVLDAARRNHQQYIQQLQFQQHNQVQPHQHQHQQQQQQPIAQVAPVQPQIPAFVDPRILSQNYQGIMAQQQQQQHQQLQVQQHHQMPPQLLPPQPMPLLPQQNSQIFNSYPPTTNSGMTLNMLGVDMNSLGMAPMLGNQVNLGIPTSLGIPNSLNMNTLNSNVNSNNNNSNDIGNRARASGMRGGDDKLFANKKCVLAASNIPYRAAAKDIIDFLNDYGINEDCIRRRYNQKGQPTGDAKIAFPTPDAAMKALKTMNKKNICGRPVFLKPV